MAIVQKKSMELTRFRGVLPPCGEGPYDGQKTSLSPGVPV